MNDTTTTNGYNRTNDGNRNKKCMKWIKVMNMINIMAMVKVVGNAYSWSIVVIYYMYLFISCEWL